MPTKNVGTGLVNSASAKTNGKGSSGSSVKPSANAQRGGTAKPVKR